MHTVRASCTNVRTYVRICVRVRADAHIRTYVRIANLCCAHCVSAYCDDEFLETPETPLETPLDSSNLVNWICSAVALAIIIWVHTECANTNFNKDSDYIC